MYNAAYTKYTTYFPIENANHSSILALVIERPQTKLCLMFVNIQAPLPLKLYSVFSLESDSCIFPDFTFYPTDNI